MLNRSVQVWAILTRADVRPPRNPYLGSTSRLTRGTNLVDRAVGGKADSDEQLSYSGNEQGTGLEFCLEMWISDRPALSRN